MIENNRIRCDESGCPTSETLPPEAMHEGFVRPMNDQVRAWATARGWNTVGADRCPNHLLTADEVYRCVTCGRPSTQVVDGTPYCAEDAPRA